MRFNVTTLKVEISNLPILFFIKITLPCSLWLYLKSPHVNKLVQLK